MGGGVGRSGGGGNKKLLIDRYPSTGEQVQFGTHFGLALVAEPDLLGSPRKGIDNLGIGFGGMCAILVSSCSRFGKPRAAATSLSFRPRQLVWSGLNYVTYLSHRLFWYLAWFAYSFVYLLVCLCVLGLCVRFYRC
jgi:hypothetical protein